MVGVSWMVLPALLVSQGARFDVTTETARRQTLLEYVQAREDLSGTEKAAWEKALRRAFGGSAIKDGTDEGITVAKSVVSGAVFFQVAPDVAAKAAYEAYHDTYRWVPPPVAINYQLLAFQGRKPKVKARELAFRFPRYFNEDIAPELARWWAEMLAAGKIGKGEEGSVREVLRETRDLMRPMMLRRLSELAELENRLAVVEGAGGGREALKKDLKDGIARGRAELQRDFLDVPRDAGARDAGRSAYDRYVALAKELGVKAEPRSTYTPPPEDKPRVKPAPPSKPPQAQVPPKVQPKPPAAPPPSVMAEVREVEAQERNERSRHRKEAPLPGDPLVAVASGYEQSLERSAQGWYGTPYLLGGIDRRGIDCSAFVRQVFREAIEIELPRNSRAQYGTGDKVASQRELVPGDMIFFDTLDRGTVTHVGVYLGNGEFAHASSSKGVTRATLSAKYYQRAFWGIRRILAY